ncbi:hypothetical protein LUTEI9C_150010 [Luteimonas sp. 9C]|nr:hypothetical protein LUTEI9C_150010 [Luteimonas sp. 9C]
MVQRDFLPVSRDGTAIGAAISLAKGDINYFEVRNVPSLPSHWQAYDAWQQRVACHEQDPSPLHAQPA